MRGLIWIASKATLERSAARLQDYGGRSEGEEESQLL
jgi:hypothetical protein